MGMPQQQGLASAAQGDWEMSEQVSVRTWAKLHHWIEGEPMGRPRWQRWTNGDALGRRTGQWARDTGEPQDGMPQVKWAKR